MSLEVVDIQEVLHKAAEGKLVKVTGEPITDLNYAVLMLERDCGNITGLRDADLFKIEKALLLEDNKALKQRWDSAIRLSTKIRMNKLRCKALDMLEQYENKSMTSSAPDISYCKTLLAGFLTEETERAKAKYASSRTNGPSEQTLEDQDEMENLRDQL